jgi:hypothetical protein
VAVQAAVLQDDPDPLAQGARPQAGVVAEHGDDPDVRSR